MGLELCCLDPFSFSQIVLSLRGYLPARISSVLHQSASNHCLHLLCLSLFQAGPAEMTVNMNACGLQLDAMSREVIKCLNSMAR